MLPRKSLVAGLGNPLRGSDAFGPAVLERLGRRSDLPAGTELLAQTTDLVGCFDRFASYELVVLVDAVLGGGGRTVAVIDEHAFGMWTAHATSSHAISPLVATSLFRTLRPEASTRFVLVGLMVSPDDFARPVTAAEAQAGFEAVLRVLVDHPTQVTPPVR